MSDLQFFSFNMAVQDETVIVASSENAQFPISNIKDPRTTKVSRSETATLTNTYVFDTITAENIDAVMVVPHSLNGFIGISGDITVKGNIIDGAWGTAPVSTTITPSDEFGFGFVQFSSSQQYRFWQIVITNTQDFTELAKICIGENKFSSFKGINNIDFGWTIQTRDNTKFRRNRYKQRFSDRINDQDVYRFSFSLLNKDELDAVTNALDEVGEHTPFWMMLDPDATISNNAERFAGYFYLNSKPVITNASFGLYNLTVTAEEAM